MEISNILNECERSYIGKNAKSNDYDKGTFLRIIGEMKDAEFQEFCEFIKVTNNN